MKEVWDSFVGGVAHRRNQNLTMPTAGGRRGAEEPERRGDLVRRGSAMNTHEMEIPNLVMSGEAGSVEALRECAAPPATAADGAPVKTKSNI